MTNTKENKLDDPGQSRRFEEAAKQLKSDETGVLFDNALRAALVKKKVEKKKK